MVPLVTCVCGCGRRFPVTHPATECLLARHVERLVLGPDVTPSPTAATANRHLN